MEEQNSLLTKLHAKRSAERRKAAKAIGSQRLVDLGPALHECYLVEKKDPRTWETQTEMILALGRLGYKPATRDIEGIVRKNLPEDMITMAAAIAHVQLNRAHLHDATPVLALLDFGRLSVISGALKALAFDAMIPNGQAIQTIINLCWDAHQHPDRAGKAFGIMDPRIYLALACSQWEQGLVKDFLKHCLNTANFVNRHGKKVEDQQLVEVCQNALLRKFTNGIG